MAREIFLDLRHHGASDDPPSSAPANAWREPITAEQYRAGLEILAAAFRMVQLVPLEPMREHLSRAETLGPMLDPTAYMRGGRENLDNQRDVIQAAGEVWAMLDRVKARMGDQS